jgi:hypothetical protein
MQKIMSLEDIREVVGDEFYNKRIIRTARRGDPDWLIDIIGELDYIKAGDKFYIEDFHGKFLEKGYSSKDFDIDKIYGELVKVIRGIS